MEDDHLCDQVAAIAASTVVIAAVATYSFSLEEKKKRPKKRRWWQRTMYSNRNKYNGCDMLRDMQEELSGMFENFCRMSSIDFEILLTLIGPIIKKEVTIWRKPIPPQERLIMTLRFLATGDSFRSIGDMFKVSNQAVSVIVREVCQALITVLKDQIKLPTSVEGWLCVSSEFDKQWNFPHCLGALDGKHIAIQRPSNSESEYLNYKKFYSIVMIALTDADYCFTFVDIGAQGGLNDADISNSTELEKKMHEKQISISHLEEPLPGRSTPVPYVIIADDAFELTSHVLKPFSGQFERGTLESVFNYRLSRAWRIVENTFGIMSSVFRVFHTTIRLEPEPAARVVHTCSLLHNFLRKSTNSRNRYSPPGTFDSEDEEHRYVPGAWHEKTQTPILQSLQNVVRKGSPSANVIRKEFADYFMTNDALPWQTNYG